MGLSSIQSLEHPTTDGQDTRAVIENPSLPPLLNQCYIHTKPLLFPPHWNHTLSLQRLAKCQQKDSTLAGRGLRSWRPQLKSGKLTKGFSNLNPIPRRRVACIWHENSRRIPAIPVPPPSLRGSRELSSVLLQFPISAMVTNGVSTVYFDPNLLPWSQSTPNLASYRRRTRYYSTIVIEALWRPISKLASFSPRLRSC